MHVFTFVSSSSLGLKSTFEDAGTRTRDLKVMVYSAWLQAKNALIFILKIYIIYLIKQVYVKKFLIFRKY